MWRPIIAALRAPADPSIYIGLIPGGVRLVGCLELKRGSFVGRSSLAARAPQLLW